MRLLELALNELEGAYAGGLCLASVMHHLNAAHGVRACEHTAIPPGRQATIVSACTAPTCQVCSQLGREAGLGWDCPSAEAWHCALRQPCIEQRTILRSALSRHTALNTFLLSSLHSVLPADPGLERRRMVHLYEAYLQSRQAPDNCYLCR